MLLMVAMFSGCGNQSVATTEAAQNPQVPQNNTAKVYTMADLQSHSSKDSCWSVIDDQVYDLTLYIASHPGGSDKIMSICGKDGSADFHGQHGQKPQMKFILTAFKVGDLSK